jgi:HD-GYP domain-containing protein (c-di-GMP phosphodiesterase class II)
MADALAQVPTGNAAASSTSPGGLPLSSIGLGQSEELLWKCRALRAELAEFVGSDFELVVRQQDVWYRVGWQNATTAEPTRASEKFASVIGEHFDARNTACVRYGQAEYLVIVPLAGNPIRDSALVGKVPAGDPVLLKRLIDVIVKNHNERARLELSKAEAECFMRQVTVDFEELTWLRNLSTYIELCEVHNAVTEVAAATLPSLCTLIGAETIALIPSEFVAGINSQAKTYVVGNSTIRASGYREIVQKYRSVATAQPVVRNLGFGEGVGQCNADIRNLILTRVGRSEHQFGWLLAINKIPPLTDEFGQEFHNAQGYSESEFGTFEAGMVSAAAVLLGSHARNVASFEEQKELFLGMIKALVNAIDAKDPYTCGHSDRVARMARCLAEELQQPPDECEHIYMSGLLHDVGKIGIPDSVLLKPSGLTDDELATIKRHPEMGAAIVEHLPQLNYALSGILHHHESFDGRGYPARLRGEDIPWFARILAVPDAYDAMTSDRPYRAGMPSEKAEQILRDGAGKQWDIKVVDAFLRRIPDMHVICGRAPQTVTSTPTPEPAKTTDEIPPSSPLAFDELTERCSSDSLLPA